MEQVPVSGGHVEAWSTGVGEPVLLIHGAVLGDSFKCIQENQSLAGYQLISYHRRGFSGSSQPPRQFGIADHAADAAAVLQYFGAETGHAVGHSYGARIALQLCLEYPHLVHSLCVLEPGLATVEAVSANPTVVGWAPIVSMWEKGDHAGATDAALMALAGGPYKSSLDRTQPSGWFEQAVDDISVLFDVELPALASWHFDVAEAGRIRSPTLNVLGERTLRRFHEGFVWLRDHLPNVESLELSAASHCLHMEAPSPVAAAIGDFLARHPMASS